MTQYREIPRQSEMFRLLAQGRVDTSPLKLLAVKCEPVGKARPKTRKADATIELGWGRKAFRFAVECPAVSTPKEIAAAAETAKQSSNPPRSFPTNSSISSLRITLFLKSTSVSPPRPPSRPTNSAAGSQRDQRKPT